MIWSPQTLKLSGVVTEPASKFLDSVMQDATSGNAPFLGVLWLLAGCPVVAILAIIVIHELGHLFAGWLVGFRFVVIRFGPIKVTAPFRISLYREGKVGAHGFTGMVPAGMSRVRTRMIVFVLAGSIANLLSAAAVMLLVHANSGFSAWFVLLAVLIGIGNLIPFSRLSTISDGKRLLMLLRNDRSGERWLAITQLSADLRNGAALEDLRPESIALATAVRDESPDTAVAHMLAYSASWYTGTTDETSLLLEICLQYSSCAPPMLREVILCDAGVFQGRKRKRTDLAQAWLADLPEKTHLPGLHQRVQAAILESQDDFHGAIQKLDEVESITLSLPDPRQRVLSLKLLRRWRSELQEKLLASQTSLNTN